MTTIKDIASRIEKGEGTLGKLSTDDKLYQDLQSTLAQLSAFVKDIEEGKGTLGRLAKDEQLYLNLNEVTSEVVKLIYDFRQNPKKFLTIKFELFGQPGERRGPDCSTIVVINLAGDCG